MPLIKVTTGLLSTADIVNDIIDALLTAGVDIKVDDMTGTLVLTDKICRKEINVRFTVELPSEEEVEDKPEEKDEKNTHRAVVE